MSRISAPRHTAAPLGALLMLLCSGGCEETVGGGDTDAGVAADSGGGDSGTAGDGGQDTGVDSALVVPADLDQDGVEDGADNCPGIPNGDQADHDQDGVGDLCDTCPLLSDPAQEDADGDGVGDACPIAPRLSGGGEAVCGLFADGSFSCWGGFAPYINSGRYQWADTYNGNNICAVDRMGGLHCHGDDSGITAAPPLERLVQVAVGYAHACALDADGAVTCWGDNSDGQTDVPASSYTALDLGSDHSCALRTDETVSCWGALGAGQESSPAGSSFVSIASKAWTTCGVDTAGSWLCWGDGGELLPAASGTFTHLHDGQFDMCGTRGDGSVQCRSDWPDPAIVIDVPARAGYQGVGVASEHACALHESGDIDCWGENNLGERRFVPERFRLLDAGRAAYCGITVDDALSCAFDDFQNSNYAELQQIPAGSFRAVSASSAGWADHLMHVCAIGTDASLTCWGDNSHGQTDHPGGSFDEVSAGQGFTCGRQGATVRCWGGIEAGIRAVPDAAFTTMDASDLYACGVTTDAALVCWGSGLSAPQGRFTRVSVGSGFACALTETGALRCFGDNEDGQLDAPPGRFVDVAAGSFHACALREDGEVLCWGSTIYSATEPPPGVYTSLSAGHYTTCAVRSSGLPECWGLMSSSDFY